MIFLAGENHRVLESTGLIVFVDIPIAGLYSIGLKSSQSMNNEKDIKMDSPLVKTIRQAYRTGQEDEALEPIVVVDSAGNPIGRFQDGDSVIFYDIRGEREIELTESLTNPGFCHFPIEKDIRLNFVTMIEYSSSLDVKVAFQTDREIKNTLTEVVTHAGMKLLKIAESEKAIHIGFFLNGRREGKFPLEERVIIPSPEGVVNYALTPDMSAAKVSDEICAKLNDPSYQVIVANLANVDVVGHIEDKLAILKAVEAVDGALGKIFEACRQTRRTLIVTSDHGTVEEWLYPDGAVNTGHTRNLVPFILADFSSEDPHHWDLQGKGELSDIAPTALKLLGLEKPQEMTGSSLILNYPDKDKARRRLLLLILDGWGMRQEELGNLIKEARTPNFDALWSQFPHALLEAAGEAVGMPVHTVGNSEAGHLHLGAGRRIFLDRVKIDKAVKDGSFFRNPAFLWAMEEAKKKNRALHLLGIVSHYSSHGTIKHLFALLRMARKMNLERVFAHALIGRRGERPESGAIYVAKVKEMCRDLSLGQVVTVIGRFWALDREFNWDRVEKTYRALVNGKGTHVPSQG
ncbi:MAG: alkaline phosphatase family protein [Candidatus Aminicenantes bacterium]|nr:alkaline phosphatase family protein [Candidatus Aminicenantes bacterium]